MTRSTDPEILAAYFATMRQFLATQSRVMSSFLGGEPAGMEPSALSMRMPTQPGIAAPAPQAAPVSPPPQPAAAFAPSVAASSPMPAPMPAAPAPQVVAPAANDRDALSRAALVELLLGLVEEKTGYPRDMVGLGQNLEADLGIDSIKRIEIVGSLLQQLPARHREALVEQRSRLNTQPTLQGMLDLIESAASTAPASASAKVDTAAPAAKVAQDAPAPPRAVMRPRHEPLPSNAARRLTPGVFVLTADHLGVSTALAAALRARDVEVAVVDAKTLAAEESLLQWCAAFAPDAPIAGLVHLAALGSPAIAADGSPAQWRQAIQEHEKSLFLLLRELGPRMPDDAHVVAASDLGGLFGREGSADDALRMAGGGVGMVKSLRKERTGLRAKAVDLDPSRKPAELAADLLGEIELDGGRQEVGYPDGERFVFHTVAEDVATDAAREAALSDVVVVATGGARGITAEVLRGLARPGNVLVLTGRSPLPEAEPADTAALADAEALRAHFVAQVRSGAAKMTPGEIGKRVQAVLGLREMLANVADLRAGGATVEYHAVDVVDEGGIRALVEGVVARHGRIDGVVHGAGVIEDKLLADKRSDSWSRVVDTKVVGMLLLQKFVDPSRLKFFNVFSSVAGRYGNSGQSDYATANELMNRLCNALQARWGERVAVSALCWGPWGPTKFGAGMVTAETEAKFAEQGVRLVSAALGRKLFREELSRAAGTPVEIVCGEALWDTREAELGVIHHAAGDAPGDGEAMGPLIGFSQEIAGSGGERILPLRLDATRHRYLHEHVLDGKPVLPAAVALELMAEAAKIMWPGWRVVEVRDHKLFKGVELKGMDARDSARTLQVRIAPPPYGSSEGFEVAASLESELAPGRFIPHYRCVLRLEQMLPAPERTEREFHDDKALSTAKAYGEWLFHGPRFQVIERIDGLSPQGAGASVRSTRPAQWLADGANDQDGWVFDPGLLDAAAQMAWLWSRAYRDESALPARFGRVVRYRERFPERMHMQYTRVPTDDPSLIRGNLVFLDDAGETVMSIEELDSVASAALNRFGGTAREAANVTA
jgi:NAD(P)-dependent dehydrogenase (short-subunit alcohol dehydrogenase family)